MPKLSLSTIADAQQRLGRVSRPTIYSLIRSGDLRSVKIGRRRMIVDESIDAFIRRQSDEAA